MHANLFFFFFSVLELVKNASLPYKSVWPSHGVKAGLDCELICPRVDAHPTTGVRLHMAASTLLCPTLSGGKHKEPCSAVMQYSWWGRERSS